ncbi:MAG: DUF3592 domain-containing protein [Bryobacterales bacterium]
MTDSESTSFTRGRSAEWPSVQGQYRVRVRAHTLGGSRNAVRTEADRQYYPEVTYSYSVDGHDYTSTRYALGESQDWHNHREDAVEAAKAFQAGRPIAVYYDPADASSAVPRPRRHGRRLGPAVAWALLPRHGSALRSSSGRSHKARVRGGDAARSLRNRSQSLLPQLGRGGDGRRAGRAAASRANAQGASSSRCSPRRRTRYAGDIRTTHYQGHTVDIAVSVTPRTRFVAALSENANRFSRFLNRRTGVHPVPLPPGLEHLEIWAAEPEWAAGWLRC